jgi:TatD DNase family protein
LNLNQFDNDLDLVVERAAGQGVDRILVPGIDLDTSRRAVWISEKFSQVFAAVGVHPNCAGAWDKNSLADLRSLTQHPKVVAIGEIGLDYYRKWSTPPAQRTAFSSQLELAAEVQLPVIIHNRHALQELIPILSAWYSTAKENSRIFNHPGVLHSFEGDIEYALQAAAMGFFIGVSGPVTFNNARDRHEIARQITLDRLLIETDAPYLTPHPHRGKRNEPAFVNLIASQIARLKGLPIEITTSVLTKNSHTLFAWRSAD